MTVVEIIAALAALVKDLASGALAPKDVPARLDAIKAEMAAVDLAVDRLEDEKVDGP